MVGAPSSESAPHPATARRFALAAGLALVACYLWAPPLPISFARVKAAVDKVQFAFNEDTFESFANAYTRMGVYLLPAFLLVAWGLAGLLTAGATQRRLTRIVDRPPVVILLAVFAAAAAWLIGARILEQHPITLGDEYSYTFQARLYANGQLYTTDGAGLPEFDNRAIQTTKTDRRYGVGFPGHPLVLVAGLWAGDIRLVPTVFAGLNVLLVFVVVRALLGPAIALLAAAMMATSPYYVFYHATLLPQPTVIFCELLMLWCVIRCARDRHMGWGLAAAVFMAMLVVVRAQSAMLMGTPILVYLLLTRTLPRNRRVGIVALLCAGVAGGAAVLMLNAAWTSGAPLSMRLAPRPAHFDSSYSTGLGLDQGHTPKRGLANTAINFARLNMCLLGWPLSFLPLLIWCLLPGKTRWEWVLLMSALAFPAFYFFYYGRQEHYYLDAVPILMMLGAAGLVRLGQRDGPAVPTALVLAGVLVAAIGVWPFRCAYFAGRAASTIAIFDTVEAAGVHDALIIINDVHKNDRSLTGWNLPTLDGDIIFAIRLPGEAYKQTLERFPTRQPYVLDWDEGCAGYTLKPLVGELEPLSEQD